jgi:hypothetical protein
VLQRVIAYGDEWMPEGRGSVDALRARIGELQDLASEAGREPIPVTVYAPSPTSERLAQLATIGVHRVLLKAPVADASGWARFLDDSQPLIGVDR